MKNILIITPDLEILNILKLRLELNGYKVMSALDKEEAIICTKKQKPCLAIIDILNFADDEAANALFLNKFFINRKIKTAILLPRMAENSCSFKFKANLLIKKPYNISTLARQLDELISNPKRSCSSHRD